MCLYHLTCVLESGDLEGEVNPRCCPFSQSQMKTRGTDLSLRSNEEQALMALQPEKQHT